MFTRDSKILSHRLTTPLTSVANAVGDVFKPTYNQIIKSLFANNEQGFAYDPNDLSTMFQDAAGTVPVTGAGQPVGLIKDKSGRNNHAYQTNAASRPLLQRNATTGAYYLAFDGTDDFLVTNSVNFTTTDEVSLFTGVKNTGLSLYQNIVELSASASANNGAFLLRCPQDTTQILYWSSGTVAATIFTLSTTSDLLAGVVLSTQSKISTDKLNLRVNMSLTKVGSEQGAGSYGNYPLYIGRRGGVSNPFNGHIYGLVGVGRLTSGDEILAIEKELAKRTGVMLSV